MNGVAAVWNVMAQVVIHFYLFGCARAGVEEGRQRKLKGGFRYSDFRMHSRASSGLQASRRVASG